MPVATATRAAKQRSKKVSPRWASDPEVGLMLRVQRDDAVAFAELVERYRGRVFAYTPLNEPRITAWYCGRIGWWPPFLQGWRGFVAVTLAACRGIVETARALRDVDPDILIAHVDATDLYVTDVPSLQAEAKLRQDSSERAVVACSRCLPGRGPRLEALGGAGCL